MRLPAPSVVQLTFAESPTLFVLSRDVRNGSERQCFVTISPYGIRGAVISQGDVWIQDAAANAIDDVAPDIRADMAHRS